MNWLEALILGLIQGLTEFLPVSSSGHLELGKVILDIDAKQNMTFTIVVHGATVLSTIIIFYKSILNLLKGLIELKWNDSTKYIVKIIVSMIPVGIVGIFFKEKVESFFTGDVFFVGSMLLVTAVLLALSQFVRTKQKQKTDLPATTVLKGSKAKEIPFTHAFIIGIVQAFAVLPGISRSGATIAIGLLLGNKKEDIAKFSFLMVLIPVIGANIKDLLDSEFTGNTDIRALPLIIGFIAAFVSGLFACKWMINIVKRQKLIYFAVYCLIIGLIAIFVA